MGRKSKQIKELEIEPVRNLPRVTRWGGNSLYVQRNKGPTGAGKVTLKPAAYVLLENAARSGRDLTTMAKLLGVDYPTFMRLRKDDPKVQEAIDAGHGGLGDELTDLLLKASRDGHVVAAIYLSKARLHWRDSGPIDPNTAAAGPQVNIQINGAPLTPADFARLTVETTPGNMLAPPLLIDPDQDQGDGT